MQLLPLVHETILLQDSSTTKAVDNLAMMNEILNDAHKILKGRLK